MPQTVTFSNEQARAFAEAIMPDVRRYIDDHQEEYQRYLREVWEPMHREAVN